MTSTLFFYRDLESITVVRDVAFALFFTLLATCRVYNRLERRLLSHTWLLVGLICMFLCFFSKQTLYEGRTAIVIFDSEEDPNFFCMYFIFPMLFALEAWMQGRHRLHWPLLYCILLFYAVLRTGSPVSYTHLDVYKRQAQYRPGYFEFEKDGFGPVCRKVDEVLNALQTYLAGNMQLPSLYKKRVDTFFPLLRTEEVYKRQGTTCWAALYHLRGQCGCLCFRNGATPQAGKRCPLYRLLFRPQ